ncbi:hypothetical protein Poly51_62860 [Rubripirellula tenax]|uniref:Uncharacterized protein n=1 Tax=Rubripirellula tenax TaxID=2528015 RepID=A0A5C6E7J0_9BACT|nr:hypothetical protein [Rubripirellula tenax]TWU43631.1 hypothetical protein Poly51_62860 [Rubripirellula tenax]
MRYAFSSLTVCLAIASCSIGSASEGAKSLETIEVPASYPHSWLEKQPHMLAPSVTSIRQEDDGTLVITNATPTIVTTGDVRNPTEVIAFAELGTRSIILTTKKDSRVYKALKANAFLKHGDARVPRFDVVGKLKYRAPITNGQADWLNPVAVLDVETVRFYLVGPETP